MNLKVKVIRSLAAAGLALTMTTGVAFASIGSAVVTGDSLRLRSEASTASAILATAAKGTQVTVLEQSVEGWYKVAYQDLEGYMSAEWLDVTLDAAAAEVAEAPVPMAETPEEAAAPEEAAQPEEQKAIVTDGPLNVREGAGTEFAKVGSLKLGAMVTILNDEGNGWYQISTDSLTGYVSADYVQLYDGTYTGNALGASAAAMAAQLLGCRYVSGGAGPNGFDCSGLMYYIYKQLGHPIARGSSSQYYKSGYFVPFNEMQPGDLIFFFDRRFDSSGGTLPTTHVGMYVGNGQFIHASTTSYRVQYDSVSGYYAPYIVGAKRIG